MHPNMSSTHWLEFCIGFNVLRVSRYKNINNKLGYKHIMTRPDEYNIAHWMTIMNAHLHDGDLQGLYSLKHTPYTVIGAPIMNLRPTVKRRRFIMGMPIPTRRCLFVKRGPLYLLHVFGRNWPVRNPLRCIFKIGISFICRSYDKSFMVRVWSAQSNAFKNVIWLSYIGRWQFGYWIS